MYYTYMLRCADGSLYTGITTDPARRFAQHTGKLRGGAKYTASRRPVCMEAIWRAPGHTAAAQLEARIKTLTKTEKEQLIRGHVPDRLSLTSFSRIQTEPDGRRIPMLFVCYPRCSTCKKAQKWLEENQVPYTFRDIKEDNPTLEELKTWHAQSGLPLKKFFNTSGQLYRSMELSRKLPDMSEEEQLALLASDGLLVKRPIAVDGDKVLVGFKQADWEAQFR